MAVAAEADDAVRVEILVDGTSPDADDIGTQKVPSTTLSSRPYDIAVAANIFTAFPTFFPPHHPPSLAGTKPPAHNVALLPVQPPHFGTLANLYDYVQAWTRTAAAQAARDSRTLFRDRGGVMHSLEHFADSLSLGIKEFEVVVEDDSPAGQRRLREYLERVEITQDAMPTEWLADEKRYRSVESELPLSSALHSHRSMRRHARLLRRRAAPKAGRKATAQQLEMARIAGLLDGMPAIHERAIFLWNDRRFQPIADGPRLALASILALIMPNGNMKGPASFSISFTRRELAEGFITPALTLVSFESFGRAFAKAGDAQAQYDLYLATMTELNAALGELVAGMCESVVLPDCREALRLRHHVLGTMLDGPGNFYTQHRQANVNVFPSSRVSSASTPATPDGEPDQDLLAAGAGGSDSPAAAWPAAGSLATSAIGLGLAASAAQHSPRDIVEALGARFGTLHADNKDDEASWSLLIPLGILPAGSHGGCFFDPRTGTYIEWDPNDPAIYVFRGVDPHVGTPPTLPPTYGPDPLGRPYSRSIIVNYPSKLSARPDAPVALDAEQLVANRGLFHAISPGVHFLGDRLGEAAAGGVHVVQLMLIHGRALGDFSARLRRNWRWTHYEGVAASTSSVKVAELVQDDADKFLSEFARACKRGWAEAVAAEAFSFGLSVEEDADLAALVVRGNPLGAVLGESSTLWGEGADARRRALRKADDVFALAAESVLRVRNMVKAAGTANGAPFLASRGWERVLVAAQPDGLFDQIRSAGLTHARKDVAHFVSLFGGKAADVRLKYEWRTAPANPRHPPAPPILGLDKLFPPELLARRSLYAGEWECYRASLAAIVSDLPAHEAMDSALAAVLAEFALAEEDTAAPPSPRAKSPSRAPTASSSPSLSTAAPEAPTTALSVTASPAPPAAATAAVEARAKSSAPGRGLTIRSGSIAYNRASTSLAKEVHAAQVAAASSAARPASAVPKRWTREQAPVPKTKRTAPVLENSDLAPASKRTRTSRLDKEADLRAALVNILRLRDAPSANGAAAALALVDEGGLEAALTALAQRIEASPLSSEADGLLRSAGRGRGHVKAAKDAANAGLFAAAVHMHGAPYELVHHLVSALELDALARCGAQLANTLAPCLEQLAEVIADADDQSDLGSAVRSHFACGGGADVTLLPSLRRDPPLQFALRQPAREVDRSSRSGIDAVYRLLLDLFVLSFTPHGEAVAIGDAHILRSRVVALGADGLAGPSSGARSATPGELATAAAAAAAATATAARTAHTALFVSSTIRAQMGSSVVFVSPGVRALVARPQHAVGLAAAQKVGATTIEPSAFSRWRDELAWAAEEALAESEVGARLDAMAGATHAHHVFTRVRSTTAADLAAYPLVAAPRRLKKRLRPAVAPPEVDEDEPVEARSSRARRCKGKGRAVEAEWSSSSDDAAADDEYIAPARPRCSAGGRGALASLNSTSSDEEGAPADAGRRTRKGKGEQARITKLVAISSAGHGARLADVQRARRFLNLVLVASVQVCQASEGDCSRATAEHGMGVPSGRLQEHVRRLEEIKAETYAKRMKRGSKEVATTRAVNVRKLLDNLALSPYIFLPLREQHPHRRLRPSFLDPDGRPLPLQYRLEHDVRVRIGLVGAASYVYASFPPGGLTAAAFPSWFALPTVQAVYASRARPGRENNWGSTACYGSAAEALRYDAAAQSIPADFSVLWGRLRPHGSPQSFYGAVEALASSGLAGCGKASNLTVALLAGDLALDGVIRMPTATEMGQVISDLAKGAQFGLCALGLLHFNATMTSQERSRATQAAFVRFHTILNGPPEISGIKDELRADLKLLGVDFACPIFLENLLCKIVRSGWGALIKTDWGEEDIGWIDYKASGWVDIEREISSS